MARKVGNVMRGKSEINKLNWMSAKIKKKKSKVNAIKGK